MRGLLAVLLFAQVPVIHVTEGKSVELKLGFAPAQGVCDDTSIAHADISTGKLMIVGVKAGETQCGFWVSGDLPPRVYHIVVDAPK